MEKEDAKIDDTVAQNIDNANEEMDELVEGSMSDVGENMSDAIAGENADGDADPETAQENATTSIAEDAADNTSENASSNDNTGENTEGDTAQKDADENAAKDVAEKDEADGKNKKAKKLSKKQKIAIIVAVVLVVILGAVGVVYLLQTHKDKGQASQQNSNQNTTELGKLEKLKLSGNGLSDFDLAFMQIEDGATNKVYSPLSIKYALGMLSEGAAGNSKIQIDTLIGDYQPRAYINSVNRSLANALFVRSGFKDNVKSSYVDTLMQKYNAEVIYDEFNDATTVNNWISDKTLGIVNQAIDDDTVSSSTFMLTNALAIDMNWNYLIQCATRDNITVPCKNHGLSYSVRYNHEDYYQGIGLIADEKYGDLTFNDKDNTKAVEFGASINNYDIITEIGEEKIRETVKAEYEKWLQSEEARYASNVEQDVDKYMDKYMEEIKANYGQYDSSTDFYMYNGENEKVFAKDLQQYDGATLQYVAIMPKNEELSQYVKGTNAEKLQGLIKNLRTIKSDNFKEGVVTTVTGKLPLYNFDYELSLKEDLQDLGVTDVFDSKKADLSNMLDVTDACIDDAKHKASIEFSNEGIKAAAVTTMFGAGAGGPAFEYNWEVPVEEIDMTFDNPFLFLIRDKDTGEVWFTGTVYEGIEN